ncbi:SNF2 domain-containing protein / helicase domain-containing protein / zinc finger protein-like protein [Tasmannia lanceolata]|uniref:SNF2 domain-containing protein / helicase domain-containing protein / zinc finger protein-like protein n=1 Tax=Tasmannia lanceolata TaxID=3420 RepID=UPI004062FA35
MKEWIFGSFLRCCSVLIRTLVRISFSEFAVEEARYSSTYMMDIDPIDIISSDSENEMEVGHIEKGTSSLTGNITSTALRKLPPWASTSGSNSKSSDGKSLEIVKAQMGSENGNTGQSEDVLYMENIDGITSDNYTDRRQLPRSFMNGMPLMDYHSKKSIPLIEISGSGKSIQSMGGGGKTSLGSDLIPQFKEHLKEGLRNGSELDLDGISNGRGNVMNHRAHFQIHGDPVPEHDKPSFQNTLRRILPFSLQPPIPTTESKSSIMNGGDSKNHDFRGNYPSVGASATDRKFSMNNDLAKDNDEEVIMYENFGTRRLLPPSLIRGKSVTNPQPAGLSDVAHLSGAGEERPAENDERLIFQAALQDLAQPKQEASIPDGLLSVPLLRHQKIALAWMIQKEAASTHCLGGILADDQGLGKTISVIALIQMQRSLSKSTSDDLRRINTEALNLDEDDDSIFELDEVKKIEKSDDLIVMPTAKALPASQKGRPAAGTLVVCPASVLRQWARELDEKVGPDAKLSVLIYHGSTRTKDPVKLARYDVVLTTYSIVTNEVPKQRLADDDDGEQRNKEKYALSSDFSTNKKRKNTSNAGKKGKKSRKEVDGSALDYDSGPLARVGWLRVVLDEAQTIKNHRTQVARACCGLRAKKRWCLSGTPIQNAIDDLYSYFRFLKYDPYSDYKSFCSALKFPIARNASNGYKKLQAVLKTVMLRRTKGTLIDGDPIIQLPPKSICLKKVDFTPEERSFYTTLEADSRQRFKAYAAAGTVKQNYANILLMLLRLRQACDSPLLVKEYHSDPVGKASLEMAKKLPREMQINLLNLLETSLAICAVCSDPPEDAVVTMCGHVFCYQCVSEYLTGDDHSCPVDSCRDQLGSDSVFSRATLISCISDELDNNNATSSSGVAEEFTGGQNMCSSSKIKAAMDILHSICTVKNGSSTFSSDGCNEISFSSKSTTNGVSECLNSDVHSETHISLHSRLQPGHPEKAIIFSQWTSMLDLLETSLKEYSIEYRRLDGRMSLPARDKAVKDFTIDPKVTVMIMSLKAGNLGLNMVAACHVILLDLWWNPTTEDQAIDRAHRIGQTRPVTVSRLTIKDTVEDRILALQEEKRKMVASAFGEDPTGSFATRLTVEDLKYLFMGSHAR